MGHPFFWDGWTGGTLILGMQRVIGTGATRHWRGNRYHVPLFPQKARLSSLWMTVQLLNELQTRDTGDENKDVVRRGRPDGAPAVSWPG